MNKDLLYQIALTLVPNIGDVHAKILVGIFGDAESVFKAKKKELECIEGIGTIRASCIKTFDNFLSSEEEIKFIEKYKISPLFITDSRYPQRLLNCYDSPTLLYYRGNADLNTSKIVSIVGTRNNSEYGRNICEKLVEDLQEENILIVSGLAFGIDTIAHKAAIKNNLQTIGVLAHGLDKIYPAQNKILAKQMIDQGGLLTDYLSNTNPDKQNFPKRNRIVAGMCDALVVIESGKKGGSLITAELGNGYNKDVFAFPGKTTDTKSEGCNYLIKNNKAFLITDAEDLLTLMNWTHKKKKSPKKQRELFIELTDNEKIIVDILSQNESLQIDELYIKCGLSSSAMAAALLQLEMQQVVITLPGKIYKLN
ncbi:DNA-processing protein DprA [Ferruginibacter lapsinanis]|uniref:DNA-processing protein DprA n=1 Tax=Ferruginibacter lapsinanis TaxID=563172 RepID=UPI001E3FE59F|nr:DNA-processing protein DprA [Ferruginibacter lapsinanis]UEG48498.1 DNA-processing protein DprA [Ferruginibacter lapsinanis]